jgi:hypothetical protein
LKEHIKAAVEALKDFRARGNYVVCIPWDLETMIIKKTESQSFGMDEAAYAREERMRFVVLKIGPGEWRDGIKLPLDVFPGDIVVTNVTSSCLREDYNQPRFIINGQPVFLFDGRMIEHESGDIFGVVGHTALTEAEEKFGV